MIPEQDYCAVSIRGSEAERNAASGRRMEPVRRALRDGRAGRTDRCREAFRLFGVPPVQGTTRDA